MAIGTGRRRTGVVSIGIIRVDVIQEGTIIGKKGVVIGVGTIVGVKTGGKRGTIGIEGIVIGKKGVMIGVETVVGVVTDRGR